MDVSESSSGSRPRPNMEGEVTSSTSQGISRSSSFEIAEPSSDLPDTSIVPGNIEDSQMDVEQSGVSESNLTSDVFVERIEIDNVANTGSYESININEEVDLDTGLPAHTQIVCNELLLSQLQDNILISTTTEEVRLGLGLSSETSCEQSVEVSGHMPRAGSEGMLGLLAAHSNRASLMGPTGSSRSTPQTAGPSRPSTSHDVISTSNPDSTTIESSGVPGLHVLNQSPAPSSNYEVSTTDQYNATSVSTSNSTHHPDNLGNRPRPSPSPSTQQVTSNSQGNDGASLVNVAPQSSNQASEISSQNPGISTSDHPPVALSHSGSERMESLRPTTSESQSLVSQSKPSAKEVPLTGNAADSVSSSKRNESEASNSKSFDNVKAPVSSAQLRAAVERVVPSSSGKDQVTGSVKDHKTNLGVCLPQASKGRGSTTDVLPQVQGTSNLVKSSLIRGQGQPGTTGRPNPISLRASDTNTGQLASSSNITERQVTGRPTVQSPLVPTPTRVKLKRTPAQSSLVVQDTASTTPGSSSKVSEAKAAQPIKKLSALDAIRAAYSTNVSVPDKNPVPTSTDGNKIQLQQSVSLDSTKLPSTVTETPKLDAVKEIILPGASKEVPIEQGKPKDVSNVLATNRPTHDTKQTNIEATQSRPTHQENVILDGAIRADKPFKGQVPPTKTLVESTVSPISATNAEAKSTAPDTKGNKSQVLQQGTPSNPMAIGDLCEPHSAGVKLAIPNPVPGSKLVENRSQNVNITTDSNKRDVLGLKESSVPTNQVEVTKPIEIVVVPMKPVTGTSTIVKLPSQVDTPTQNIKKALEDKPTLTPVGAKVSKPNEPTHQAKKSALTVVSSLPDIESSKTSEVTGGVSVPATGEAETIGVHTLGGKDPVKTASDTQKFSTSSSRTPGGTNEEGKDQCDGKTSSSSSSQSALESSQLRKISDPQRTETDAVHPRFVSHLNKRGTQPPVNVTPAEVSGQTQETLSVNRESTVSQPSMPAEQNISSEKSKKPPLVKAIAEKVGKFIGKAVLSRESPSGKKTPEVTCQDPIQMDLPHAQSRNTDQPVPMEVGTCESSHDTKQHEQELLADEPKVEKLTLKLHKDRTVYETFVETASKQAGQTDPKLDSKQSEEQFSVQKEDPKVEKLTLKLRKDVKEIPSSSSMRPLEVNVTNQPKITLKLKKDPATSQTVIESPTEVSEEDLKQSDVVSSSAKKEPKVEKLTLKLIKDPVTGNSERVATKQLQDKLSSKLNKELVISEAATSGSDSGLNKQGKVEEEKKVEKLTLKLKKGQAVSESHAEKSPTVAEGLHQPKNSDKHEKITLKLKKDPVTSELVSETASPTFEVDSKITEKPVEEETAAKHEKITLKFRKDPITSEITNIQESKIDTEVTPSTSDGKQTEEKHEKITLKLKKDPITSELMPERIPESVSSKQHSTGRDIEGSEATSYSPVEELKVQKLTLKLRKDPVSSETVTDTASSSEGASSIINRTAVDSSKPEDRVEKITLTLKKDAATSELIAEKKVKKPEAMSEDVSLETTGTSKDEPKLVEKLTLKLKKDQSGKSLDSETLDKDSKKTDSVLHTSKSDTKLDKLTIRLTKDGIKCESPKTITGPDSPSTSEVKIQESELEVTKPEKIKLTFKKDAAWSVQKTQMKGSGSPLLSGRSDGEDSNGDVSVTDTQSKRQKLDVDIVEIKSVSEPPGRPRAELSVCEISTTSGPSVSLEKLDDKVPPRMKTRETLKRPLESPVDERPAKLINQGFKNLSGLSITAINPSNSSQPETESVPVTISKEEHFRNILAKMGSDLSITIAPAEPHPSAIQDTTTKRISKINPNNVQITQVAASSMEGSSNPVQLVPEKKKTAQDLVSSAQKIQVAKVETTNLVGEMNTELLDIEMEMTQFKVEKAVEVAAEVPLPKKGRGRPRKQPGTATPTPESKPTPKARSTEVKLAVGRPKRSCRVTDPAPDTPPAKKPKLLPGTGAGRKKKIQKDDNEQKVEEKEKVNPEVEDKSKEIKEEQIGKKEDETEKETALEIIEEKKPETGTDKRSPVSGVVGKKKPDTQEKMKPEQAEKKTPDTIEKKTPDKIENKTPDKIENKTPDQIEIIKIADTEPVKTLAKKTPPTDTIKASPVKPTELPASKPLDVVTKVTLTTSEAVPSENISENEPVPMDVDNEIDPNEKVIKQEPVTIKMEPDSNMESVAIEDQPKPSHKKRNPQSRKKSRKARPKARNRRPPPKQSTPLRPSTVQNFEEETRMSADCNSRSQTPARTMATASNVDAGNEESQGSVTSNNTGTPGNTNRNQKVCSIGRMEIEFGGRKDITVEQIAEYQWPADKTGDHYMIQEQISEYLKVKSFKRKYPDLTRRQVEMEERTYLTESGLVSEQLCELGLTAVSSAEVLDIMYTDFQEKYEEYRRYIREKAAKEFSSKQKAIQSATTERKMDFKEKAIQSAASWNSSFNRTRRDERRCFFDLQNFTIQFPQNRLQKITPKIPKVGHYPVSLIPGQFTDFYKSYTPTELRYFPLNTVLYGPMKPNQIYIPGSGGSDGSLSDSDSSSSSDDSSSSSSDGSDDSDDSGSTAGDTDTLNLPGEGGGAKVKEEGPAVKVEVTKEEESAKTEVKNEPKNNSICKMCTSGKNKEGQEEVLIHCAQCSGGVHPSCLDLTEDMLPHIRRYAWQCTDCKTCCLCKDPADEDKMLFCDMCDRGYHIYCVGLRRVPTGRWHCKECAVCGSCGTLDPGGATDTGNAQWQHEYKKGDKGARVYAQTLCVPCSKLWRKGRYCQLCCRCYSNRPEDEEGLVNCSACDKWMHTDCCHTTRNGDLNSCTTFICEICQEKGQSRSSTIKTVSRASIKV